MSQDPHWSFETRQVHAGQVPDPTTGARGSRPERLHHRGRGPFRLIPVGERHGQLQLLELRGLESSLSIGGHRTLCDDLDHFYVTDAAERFATVAERFLGTKPTRLEAIELV